MSKLTCISPIDGSVYAEREIQSAAEITAIVGKARDAQKAWAAVAIVDRVKIVEAAIAALEAMNDEIVLELAHLMGRPVRYGGEIGGVKERAYHMTSIGEASLQPTVIEDSDDFSRYIAKEPVGVVLVIAPWNYPFLTAVNSIVPALVAGNAVVLKHSTQTLIAGERFAQAFEQAGLPAGLFSNIFVSHDITSELLKARTFDFINFTGSVGGGKQIERAAAGTFVGVGLELGGKDPGYVRADANVDTAVDTLIDGAMFNSGQCCCGIERIYVHESLFDEFVAKAKAIVEGYVLGNPLDEATTLGPMAHKRFADEVRAQISEALAAGATSVIDRTRFTRDNGEDAYLAPEILVNVDHSMRVMKDESFGPVVGIMKVSSDAEAIELMNDSEFGLTASIWTQDAAAAADIGRQIETGTIFMNRCDYLDPALCWTGCKDTGRGISLSAFGYDSVTRAKSYHLKKN
uniref:Aldehyde dehydrogenase n=1 Tax=OCS116 cluster bacterium TaxID=2030921 RepID=A0A2A4YZR9_9PROT